MKQERPVIVPPTVNAGRSNATSDSGTITATLLEVLSHLGIGALAFDAEGNCIFCSALLSDLLDAPVKTKFDFINLLTTDEPVRAKLQSTLEAMSPSVTSERLHLSDEKTVHLDFIRTASEPLIDVIVVRDVSSERDQQKEMSRLSRLATLGQVAAGAAHEFNNNLTSVLGWAQIAILNTDAESPAFPALEIIEENARKAKRIFTRLLDTSRNDDVPNLVTISPTDIIDEVLTLLHFEMKHAKIEVVRSTDNVGMCRVDADAIGQVFVNIFRNAIDVLDDGGIIEVKTTQNANVIDVAIKDNGPGIPEEIQRRIFDSFFSTKRHEDASTNGGTGLGLSISLDIVRQHGGDIRVESTPSEGSCFTVSLPVATKETHAVETTNHQNRPTIPPGAVVLVVDDEPDVGEMIRTSLELQGVSVLSVSSGEDAVSECERLRFDAAFVDYSMPGLSGHDLGVKLLSVQPSMPIIFMSGLTVQKNSVAEDFLKKPFDLDEIRTTLYQVLKRRKERRSSEPPE